MNPATPKVFVYEIDAEMRSALVFVISKLGIETTAFTDGLALLNAIRRQAPSAVIIGVDDGNGRAVLSGVREIATGATRIFALGTSDTALVQALELGAHDYLPKPLEKGILGKKLHRFIDTPQLRALALEFESEIRRSEPASFQMPLRILEVREDGFRAECCVLLLRGSVMNLSSPFLDEVLGCTGPHRLVAGESEPVRTATGQTAYRLTLTPAEDATHGDRWSSARRWLALQGER